MFLEGCVGNQHSQYMYYCIEIVQKKPIGQSKILKLDKINGIKENINSELRNRTEKLNKRHSANTYQFCFNMGCKVNFMYLFFKYIVYAHSEWRQTHISLRN